MKVGLSAINATNFRRGKRGFKRISSNWITSFPERTKHGTGKGVSLAEVDKLFAEAEPVEISPELQQQFHDYMLKVQRESKRNRFLAEEQIRHIVLTD